MRGMRGAPNDNDNDKPMTEEEGDQMIRALGIMFAVLFISFLVIGFGHVCYSHYIK